MSNHESASIHVQSLISNVFLQIPIWDKRLKEHTNRVIVDKCWRDVAKQMNAEEISLRKKWKYLRDQFTVEFGKLKPSRSGDPGGDDYEPKWPHYKSLLFLRDIVKPRPPASNLTQERQNVPTPPENLSEADVNMSTTPDPSENIDFVPENEDDCDQGCSPQFTPLSRNRRGVNARYNDSILAIESKKAKFLEEVVKSRQVESDDLLFFRSLLPHIERIPAHLKLRFRNRIQDVVDEFAYGVQNSSGTSLQILSTSSSDNVFLEDSDINNPIQNFSTDQLSPN